MNENDKTELMNIVLKALGIVSLVFAGFILNAEFLLACFLLICGLICVSVEVVPTEELEKKVAE